MKPMIPVVKPEWRTENVIGICHSMRESQDFSAAPILADALQDAGCDDEELLSFLRRPEGGSYADFAAAVACVLSDGAREAVAWVVKCAEELGPNYGYESYEVESGTTSPEDALVDPMDYHELMRYAKDYVDTGGDEIKVQVGDESWRNVMVGERLRKFWECYQVITGKTYKLTDESGWRLEGHFFSCSC